MMNSNDCETFFIILYFQNNNQIIFDHLASYIKIQKHFFIYILKKEKGYLEIHKSV